MPNTQAKKILGSIKTTISQLRSEISGTPLTSGMEISNELSENINASGWVETSLANGPITGNTASMHLNRLEQLATQLETLLK